MAKAKVNENLNNEEVMDQAQVPAPKPETDPAVPETGDQQNPKPNPLKAIGEGIKKHWKGFLIGAGAAAGAAVLAFIKGRDSVYDSLAEAYDDEEEEDDDDSVDVEVTEVDEC